VDLCHSGSIARCEVFADFLKQPDLFSAVGHHLSPEYIDSGLKRIPDESSVLSSGYLMGGIPGSPETWELREGFFRKRDYFFGFAAAGFAGSCFTAATGAFFMDAVFPVFALFSVLATLSFFGTAMVFPS